MKLTAVSTLRAAPPVLLPARLIQHQGWRIATTAPMRRSVIAASKDQTVWNGEGPDYTMRDVERFHEEEAARLRHMPADMGQWDGEGKDYDMKDVERFAERAAAASAATTVFNGEGPDFDMRDVERFHDEMAARARHAAPDPSQYNGEGPDFDMRDVERFHDEAMKDKAVRRK